MNRSFQNHQRVSETGLGLYLVVVGGLDGDDRAAYGRVLHGVGAVHSLHEAGRILVGRCHMDLHHSGRVAVRVVHLSRLKRVVNLFSRASATGASRSQDSVDKRQTCSLEYH